MVVTDVARLYESARGRVIEDDFQWAGDPISEAEIEEQIGSREDHDIQACVETLFEPPTDSPPGTGHNGFPKMSNGVRSHPCTASEPARREQPRIRGVTEVAGINPH